MDPTRPERDTMLANRLRKNLARLGPAFARERTDAFRLYDRDIKELPFTIDRYGPATLVTEFVSPLARRAGDEHRAAERAEVERALHTVIGPGPVHWRSRERHVSFERQSRGAASNETEVLEHGLRFGVNLVDYLDTGLFLDHRPSRRRIGLASAGKSVLNLYCYTGAFTVHAAAGKARRTVSVDLSDTYLDWAGRNLGRNGVQTNGKGPHTLVAADAFAWLASATERFDLIVLDPPTLSRSARGKSFDVQRDHPELLKRALARLAPGGTLLFSTNFQRFALDSRALAGRAVRDVTTESTPRDVRQEAHRCWEIG